MIIQEKEKKNKKEHYSNAMIIVDCSTLFGGNVQSYELRPQKHETRKG